MDRKEKINKVVELYKQGESMYSISKELKMHRSTIKKYLVQANVEIRVYRNNKLNIEEIESIMNDKYPDYQYVNGYIGMNNKMIIQCKHCGYEFEYTSQILKSNKNLNIQCDRCNQLQKLANVITNTITQYQKQDEKETDRIIKEDVEALRRIARKHKHYLECQECNWMFFTNRIDRKTCSVVCSNKRNNRIKEIKRREVIRDNGKIDWDITLDKLIDRDNNICYICGGECDKEDYILDKDNNFIVGSDYPSIDHVIPISKGGTHTWDNVRLAHHHCNSIKKDSIVNEGETG